jgi:putative spermidine/putrescine transport system permease protein
LPSIETQPHASRRTAAAVAFARKSRGGLLLLLPALGYLCLFFFLPLVFLLLQSALTPDNYLRVFRESVYLDVMYRTARMSLAVTGVCLVLGYPFAYFMSTASERMVNVAVGVVILPFWTSILVRSYAWLVLLQREGIVNKVLLNLKLIDHPLKLVYNLNGVICGISYIMLPYMILVLYASMRNIDLQLLVVARSLGATRLRAFYRIFVPLTASGVMAGCSLVFILSFGYFITPALLGGREQTTFSMLIDIQMNQLLDWRFGATLSAVLLLVIMLLVVAVRRIVRVERSVQWIQ